MPRCVEHGTQGEGPNWVCSGCIVKLNRKVNELIAERDKLKEENLALKGRAPKQLQVWLGQMPESNGKTNHTVIIHSGDLTTGMTVYRSEYPGRAQYEADCWTWLINGVGEKPFIVSYDADEHSGYVAPPSKLEQAIKLLEEAKGKLYIDTQMKLRVDNFLWNCKS